LPVHPLCGARLDIVARYGHHTLRVEQSDGRLRLLPVAWTDLMPRPAALVVDGRPVRLAPEALRQLGAWVAARITPGGPPGKLDSADADARKLNLDAAPRDGAAGPHRAGEGPPLVEQTGPSRAGRRDARPKRGRR
jgi:hypothetical protein